MAAAAQPYARQKTTTPRPRIQKRRSRQGLRPRYGQNGGGFLTTHLTSLLAAASWSPGGIRGQKKCLLALPLRRLVVASPLSPPPASGQPPVQQGQRDAASDVPPDAEAPEEASVALVVPEGRHAYPLGRTGDWEEPYGKGKGYVYGLQSAAAHGPGPRGLYPFLISSPSG